MRLLFIFLILPFTLPAQDDSTWTVPLWRGRLLVRDALRSYSQDTIIEKQDSLINLSAEEKEKIRQDFERLLLNSQEKYKHQSEIADLESSLKVHYLKESRKFKRQRNIVYGILTGVAGLVIWKTFYPP